MSCVSLPQHKRSFIWFLVLVFRFICFVFSMPPFFLASVKGFAKLQNLEVLSKFLDGLTHWASSFNLHWRDADINKSACSLAKKPNHIAECNFFVSLSVLSNNRLEAFPMPLRPMMKLKKLSLGNNRLKVRVWRRLKCFKWHSSNSNVTKQ